MRDVVISYLMQVTPFILTEVTDNDIELVLINGTARSVTKILHNCEYVQYSLKIRRRTKFKRPVR